MVHTPLYRVVLVDDADYPGFCRVIFNRHAREMTDLSAAERAELMAAVFAVEAALRAVLAPHKINVASLGNMVPHVHWHVIPRFADDAHFPNPIWSARQRESDPSHLATRRELLPTLKAAIHKHLA
ncbi:MAG TPA: HIT family protein [Burkholderiaceae bacterium]|nr:HIT family protein [Burkholderiaceae bacterium]